MCNCLNWSLFDEFLWSSCHCLSKYQTCSAMSYNKIHLLYKHQWNTRWAFAWKLDIFTCENNMLSSHVKISPLPWFHNKSCLSHQKSHLSEMVLYFIGVYTCIVNRTLHGCLEIQNFSSSVEKYFTRSLRSLVKYFSTLEEKFRIFAWPCNILYVLWVQRVTVVVDTLKVGPRINTLNLPNIWQHISHFCCPADGVILFVVTCPIDTHVVI